MEVIYKKKSYPNYNNQEDDQDEETVFATNPFNSGGNNTNKNQERSETGENRKQATGGYNFGAGFEERYRKDKYPNLETQNKHFQNVLRMFALEVYKTTFNELFKLYETFSLIESAEGSRLSELTSSLKFINLLTKIRGISDAISNLGKGLRTDLLKASHYSRDEELIEKLNEVENRTNFLDEDFIDDINLSLSYYIPLLSKTAQLTKIVNSMSVRKARNKQIQSDEIGMEKGKLSQIESFFPQSKPSFKTKDSGYTAPNDSSGMNSPLKESLYMSRSEMSFDQNLPKLKKRDFKVNTMVAQLPGKIYEKSKYLPLNLFLFHF